MKKQLGIIVAWMIMIAGLSCSKGGGDQPGGNPPVTPPKFTISNLVYDPHTVTIQAQKLSIPVNGTVNYTNAQKGVAQLRLQTSEGGDLTVPIVGATESSGTIAGSVDIAMPLIAGTYTFQVWLVDGNGANSNKLSGSVIMEVNDAAVDWIKVSNQYSLHKVIWANNKYVAVGDFGRILSSTNGNIWIEHSTGTTVPFYAACWTGTQYVVAGFGNIILTSPDGINWTSRSSYNSFIQLQGVASSGNDIVVVGLNMANSKAVILNSTDGISWTNIDLSIPAGDLTGITWSGNQYVAVGEDMTILSSPDGINWTKRISTPSVWGNLADIVWSGSKFVASGYSAMVTSEDGITWNAYSNPSFSAPAITWSGSRFVAGSLNGIYTSTDGINWIKSCESLAVSGITWSGFQYVAVGFISPMIMISP